MTEDTTPVGDEKVDGFEVVVVVAWVVDVIVVVIAMGVLDVLEEIDVTTVGEDVVLLSCEVDNVTLEEVVVTAIVGDSKVPEVVPAGVGVVMLLLSVDASAVLEVVGVATEDESIVVSVEFVEGAKAEGDETGIVTRAKPLIESKRLAKRKDRLLARTTNPVAREQEKQNK